MANFTHTLVRSYNNWTDREQITSGSELNYSETITGGATDTAIAMTITVAKIQSFYMKCDRDITLEFNSSSAPTFTIALKATKALIWSTNCGFTSPLTANITALYATLAAGDDATLEMSFLIDPT